MKSEIACGLFALSLLLSACTTTATLFTSPNRMKNTSGVLYLANGDSLSGGLTVNNEVLLPQDVRLRTVERTEERFHVLDVRGYAVGNAQYELKHDAAEWYAGNRFFFVKRLTPENARMHVFEGKEKLIVGKAFHQPVYETVYYVQLPGERRHFVHKLDGRKLTPYFHRKMSEIVKDCPALAEKIRTKAPGYFYSKFKASKEEQRTVALRIVNEYNACR